MSLGSPVRTYEDPIRYVADFIDVNAGRVGWQVAGPRGNKVGDPGVRSRSA